jgi:hypothetical protein
MSTYARIRAYRLHNRRFQAKAVSDGARYRLSVRHLSTRALSPTWPKLCTKEKGLAEANPLIFIAFYLP